MAKVTRKAPAAPVISDMEKISTQIRGLITKGISARLGDFNSFVELGVLFASIKNIVKDNKAAGTEPSSLMKWAEQYQISHTYLYSCEKVSALKDTWAETLTWYQTERTPGSNQFPDWHKWTPVAKSGPRLFLEISDYHKRAVAGERPPLYKAPVRAGQGAGTTPNGDLGAAGGAGGRGGDGGDAPSLAKGPDFASRYAAIVAFLVAGDVKSAQEAILSYAKEDGGEVPTFKRAVLRRLSGGRKSGTARKSGTRRAA